MPLFIRVLEDITGEMLSGVGLIKVCIPAIVLLGL